MGDCDHAKGSECDAALEQLRNGPKVLVEIAVQMFERLEEIAVKEVAAGFSSPTRVFIDDIKAKIWNGVKS